MKLYKISCLICICIGISCTNKKTKIMAVSDWQEKKIVKAFESKNISSEKIDRALFEEELIIKSPFYKYEIHVTPKVNVYLIVITFSTASDAIKKATEIPNSFRKITDVYVSSGVNGNVMALVISSLENKKGNDSVFEILKDM